MREENCEPAQVHILIEGSAVIISKPFIGLNCHRVIDPFLPFGVISPAARAGHPAQPQTISATARPSGGQDETLSRSLSHSCISADAHLNGSSNCQYSHSHTAQRSYCSPTPGGDGLRPTHFRTTYQRIHCPYRRAGPERSGRQRRN